MKDNSFTVLCWFLPHSSMNQSHVYIYPSLLNLPPIFHPIPALQIVTVYQLKLPESYSKCPQAICFTYGSVCFPEKATASHSSTLAWKIPWTEEPDGLQSMGLLRVGHDWVTSLSLFTFMRWRRKWQPTPVFLPGESQGRGSLVGCRLWVRTESDTTEAT